jgi:hypothetical protein
MPGGSAIYQDVALFDSSRWVHFLAYAAVSAIPVAAWRRRNTVLLSLGGPVLGMILEALQPFISGFHGRPQNILADLFGVGAGILLGLNLRMMRNSANAAYSESHETPRSTTL